MYEAVSLFLSRAAVCGIDWSLNISTDIVNRRLARRQMNRGSILDGNQKNIFPLKQPQRFENSTRFLFGGQKGHFFRGKKRPDSEAGSSPEISDGTKYAWGHAVAQLVEALRYKSEGRGFDSR
jgi:hypothetical protein